MLTNYQDLGILKFLSTYILITLLCKKSINIIRTRPQAISNFDGVTRLSIHLRHFSPLVSFCELKQKLPPNAQSSRTGSQLYARIYFKGKKQIRFLLTMSAPQSASDKASSERVQFDGLCELCTRLFDSEAAWETKSYPSSNFDLHHRSHHDIRAMEKSADAGCHLCSLIFGQINPSDLERMREDLDEAFFQSYQQLRVLLTPVQDFYELEIEARKSRISSRSDDADDYDQIWFSIAKLKVLLTDQDYTHGERSASYSNCSDATLARIAQWMGECLTSHTRCFDIQTVAATRSILPLRLLDLAPALDAKFIRLQSSESLSIYTVYVTLSHCWGGYSKTTLTSSSLATFEAGIHMSTLPRTFQHAVIMTQKLGIRYLWIDALCILQDSTQEWSHEASLMGDIYANSTLTLSATNAPDSEGGLYHTRSPLSVWPCRVVATWDCFPPANLVVYVPGWEGERTMEPLSSRGWAFQEWLLSKRTIHFSRDQVRWQCHCLAASEIFPHGVTGYDLYIQGTSTKNIIRLLVDEYEYSWELWLRIRAEYSEKHLTVATDRLAAFSGIARMVHKVLKSPKEDFLVGLWRPELLKELLWERDPESELKATHMNYSSQYIAPSWSWASLDGSWWDYIVREYKSQDLWVYVRILAAKTFPHEDEYGPVSGGFLTIRGSLYHVEISSSPCPDWKTYSREWKVLFTQGLSISHKWSYASIDRFSLTRLSPSTRDSFYFMPMLSKNEDSKMFEGKLIGLLLEKTDNGVSQYRRAGLLELLGLDEEAVYSIPNEAELLDPDHDKKMSVSNICTIEIV